MAALHPDVPAAPRAESVRPPRGRPGRVARERQSPVARIASGIVAIAAGAAGLSIASAYPIEPTVALAAFIAWTVFAAVRFSVAWPAVLALLPVVGFATLTGWLTFEELDLLLLASACGGYAAVAWRGVTTDDAHGPGDRRHDARLSFLSVGIVALFGVSLTIALARGIADAGGLHFDWFQGYDDPLNSVRLYKSFVFALLMAPLAAIELRRPGGFDRLALGLTGGLALCSLAVLRERVAFTGLLDFSDDYRVTAPFWEMHTGGAALDGFLALSIPFAVREVVRHAGRADRAAGMRLAAGWIVLALAAYACLVTFSRGVYAAVPASLLLLVVLVFRQRLRLDRRALWSVLSRGALFAVAVAGCSFLVFRHGGYRAVLATLCVLAIAIPVESAIRTTKGSTWLAAAFAGAAAGGAGWLAAGVVPKGPYLVFAAALAAAVASVAWFERAAASTRPSERPAMFAIAAWLWLGVAACGVAGHWGGALALHDGAAVVGGLVVLSLAGSRTKRSPWPEARHERLATVGLAAAVMASVAVFSAGAYMGGRFSSTRGDLDVRIAHWTQGLGRLHGTGDWLLGKGLGRFPATSLFESPEASIPGGYRFARRDGESFVSLTAPRVKYLGFGELFRFSQRVVVRPQTTYTALLQVRSSQAGSVHVELCEKQLLYPGACVTGEPKFEAGLDGWRTVRLALPTASIGASGQVAPRPVFLAVAGGNPGAPVEVRSVRLVGPDGVDVVANGDFANRTARWFSSSDKYHLPWHIKNIALDVLFDQGALGLALFVLLVGGALLRAAVGRAFRHPDAPYVAAALAGYLVVGAFDSLLDVPRVAFDFYLLVLVALMLRNPRAARPPRGGRPDAGPLAANDPETSTAPTRAQRATRATAVAPKEPDVRPSPSAAAPVDEAAARALRRQRAFGTRGPARDA